MSDTPRAVGRPYLNARKRVLAESDVCWLCGHGDADTIDHVVPRSRGGPVHDQSNMRPAHGVEGCPTCGKRCNQERGNSMSFAPPVQSRQW